MPNKIKLSIIPAMAQTVILMCCITFDWATWVTVFAAVGACLNWYIYGKDVGRRQHAEFMDRAFHDILDNLKSRKNDDNE